MAFRSNKRMIGSVPISSTEISYLDGVTSPIQTQLDGKLNSSTASSTYAPLSSPTFTGTVVIPVSTNVQSSSYTLVLSDASKLIEMNVASGNTVTVPQPYPSWTLDANHDWQPPTPMPDNDGMWVWDEDFLTWVDVSNL